MPRTERTRAVLLRSVDFGEADRIVTLLTESHGKIGALARGARKSTKRFAGGLEAFCLIEVEMAEGRGELARLSAARPLKVFPGILGGLGRMSIAAAGLEIVRLTLADREPPDPRLFAAVLRFFERCGETDDDALRICFAVRVLSLAGFAPSLSRCGRCDREAPAGRAALFEPASGGIVCRACGGGPIKLSGALRERLGRAMGTGWELAADDEAWTDEDRQLAADAIERFCRHHLGRRLVATEASAQVRRTMEVDR